MVRPAAMDRVRAAAVRRCHRIAAEIAAEITGTAPQGETHRLRRSYYVDTHPAGRAVIRSRVDYWRYVEFGTHEHGDAQPHVRPAVEIVRARHR